MRKISWLAEDLLASREGLFCMELVVKYADAYDVTVHCKSARLTVTGLLQRRPFTGHSQQIKLPRDVSRPILQQ